MRHDFEARNERGLQHTHVRRHRNFEKFAIDSVADAQVALQRLDVNIRGAFLECFAEDLIHKIHHRGFFVGFIEHIDLLFEVIMLITAFAAFE